MVVNGVSGPIGNVVFPSSFEIPSSYSKDKTVTVLANYRLDNNIAAPFAYEKKINSGSIIYIDLNSLLSNLEAMQQSNSSALFGELGAIVNILNLPSTVKVNSPLYPINIWGNASFSGTDIAIVTPICIPLNFTNSQFASVKIAGEISLNGTNAFSSAKINLSGVEIQGASTSILQANNIVKESSSVGLGRYVSLSSNQGFSWTIDAAHNTTVLLDIQNEPPIDIKGGNITLFFNQSPFSFLVKTPQFSVTNGTAFFERAYFDYPFWNVPIKRAFSTSNPSTLSGNFSFNIGYSDGDYMNMNNFSLAGSGATTGLTLFSEWNLPWLAIFESPFNMVLVISIVALILFLKFKKSLFKSYFCLKV